MGKVLKSFSNGYAGAIARSLDDVVLALANKSGEEIPFGAPVALSADKTGIVPFDASSHTAADFVGVTVRNPSKTPDTYGSSSGSYAANELADVLVRGHIVVALDGGSALGAAVGVSASTGGFTTDSGEGIVTLTNAHVSAVTDGNDRAEILLNTRNIL